MKRIIPVVVLLAGAAFIAFRGIGSDEAEGPPGFDVDSVLAIEKRLGMGDIEGANKFFQQRPPRGAAERHYAAAAIAFTEGRHEDARREAHAARETAPAAWRPLSIEFAALTALGRTREAGALALSAVEAAPNDERVLAAAAHHLATDPEQPDPRRALELLDRIDALTVHKAAPDSPSAIRPEQILKVRYTAALVTGLYETALAVAHELARSSPKNPEYLVMIAEAARRGGHPDIAIEQYEAALEIADGVRDLPEPFRRQVHLWRRQLIQIQLQHPAFVARVLHHTEVLVAQDSGGRESRVLRARALTRSDTVRENGPDEAVAVYRALLAENPDDLEVLRNLALLLYDWKQAGRDGTYLDEAHDLLRRYRLRGGEIDIALADTWNKLQLRAVERSAPELIDPFAAAFEAEPGNAERAEAYRARLLEAGKETEAGAVVRRALDAAPESPSVRLLAARHFLAPGADLSPPAALAQLAVVAEAFGSDDRIPESVRWLRCHANLMTENHEAAFDDAKLLLGLRPRDATYLTAGARAALATGRRSHAEAWIREAILIADSPALREMLTEALAGTGK